MRPDIQTLRAIAVLLVLLWHAGVPGVSGGYVGVDVFFVLSGFLMTQILLNELIERNRVDLPRFYLRRARRLFPAAAVAVLGTTIITLAFLPITRWRDIAVDILASAFYVVNWRLAERSVDYLAAESTPSPVQHFWSLAVEEQFYLVWPLLLAVVVFLPRRRWGFSVWVLIVMSAVLLISLAYSAWFTQTDPGPAYFVTTTRVWELAIGGLVAAVWRTWSRHPPGRQVATCLTSLGLAAIAISAVTYDSSTAFPGVAALLPTVGTATVLLGGPYVAASGATARLLALAPAQWIGAMSYSLYLWHWPLLVAAAALLDQQAVKWPVGLIVVGLSLLPAWLSLRFVEAPFRRRLPGHQQRRDLRKVGSWVAGYAGVSALAALAIVVAPTVLGSGGLLSPGESVQAISPAPEEARDDVYQRFYDGCDALSDNSLATVCVGGDPEASETIALVGDSHAVMWMTALDAAGAENGWRIELLARSSCPIADVIPMADGEPKQECSAWRDEVLDHLQDAPPTAIITAQVPIYPLWEAGRELSKEASEDAFTVGLEQSWTDMRSTGATIVSVAPTPRFVTDQPECVVENPRNPDECGEPASTAEQRTQGPVAVTLKIAPWVKVVDLNPLLCPDGFCPAVQNGVLVWGDTNHLTATRAEELAGPLGAAVRKTLSESKPKF